MDAIGGKQLSVLQVVFRMSGEAYGVAIDDALDADGEPTALPQIYSVLQKLEGKGLISSMMGEPTSKRGGRRKRFYKITGKGQRVLSESLSSKPRLKESTGWVQIPGSVKEQDL
jgi:DNA-binding PadR family transcriptional regulator